MLIPSTVWACGATPVEPETIWPASLVAKIVRAFSLPGARVVLLPWPTAGRRNRNRTARPPSTGPDGEVDAALEATLEKIADIGRTSEVVRLQSEHASYAGRELNAAAVSRPFWADLVGEPDADAQVTPDQPGTLAGAVRDGGLAGSQADADLIIASHRPQPGHADVLDAYRDLVALTAARRLRVGGVLAVLTHCDWSTGTLVDPTGPIVASAQNADLLYLQHIVALHRPLRDRHRHPAPDDIGGPATPHERISSDLLVFAQPRDYQPPPTAPAAPQDEEARR